MKRPELRVEGSAFAGKRFSVPAEGLRLGRSSSNDIAVHDEELSRNHCFFEQSGDSGIRVTDLASANGTFVNEKRLAADPVELKPGDVVRVGGTFVSVLDEEPKRAAMNFDLGLGKTKAGRTAPGAETPARKRSPLTNVLWGVVVVALGLAAYLMLLPPAVPAARTEPLAEEKPSLVELRYEMVAADSETICRHYMSLTPDGVLHVTIDDLSGAGRHVDRSAKLKDAARDRLMEILSDGGFASLDSEYAGPEEDPPKLNSWEIRYLTTAMRQDVRVVNTQEPADFRRVREKLVAFAMNELGIRGLQYTREQLVEMAHAAADTGRMKWEDREVDNGNLFASIRAYREALSDLETVNPKPPEFEEYREAVERATKELDERYRNQRFVAEQATSVGDWEKAKTELRILCEMIPDREDDRNREASVKLIDVEKRLNKKGGR